MKLVVLFAALAGVILSWFATTVLQANSAAQPDDMTGVIGCAMFGILAACIARFWFGVILQEGVWGRRLSVIARYVIAPFFAGATATGMMLILHNGGTTGLQILCRDLVIAIVNFNLCVDRGASDSC